MMPTQKDIDKLLAGRAIIDAYRAQHLKGIDESAGLAGKLRAIGFTSDNPTGEFFKFNEQMCIEAIKAIPVYGECDSCKDHSGTPKCQVWFGNGGCAVTKVMPNKENLYQAILALMRKKTVGYKTLVEGLAYYKGNVDTKTSIYWFCTQGHGFYCKPFEAMTVENKFSLNWS